MSSKDGVGGIEDFRANGTFVAQIADFENRTSPLLIYNTTCFVVSGLGMEIKFPEKLETGGWFALRFALFERDYSWVHSLLGFPLLPQFSN